MKAIAGYCQETRIAFMVAASDRSEIATGSPETTENRVETALRSREMTGQAIAHAITDQKTASYTHEPVREAGRNVGTPGIARPGSLAPPTRRAMLGAPFASAVGAAR